MEAQGLRSQWACRLARQLIKAHHGEITEVGLRAGGWPQGGSSSRASSGARRRERQHARRACPLASLHAAAALLPLLPHTLMLRPRPARLQAVCRQLLSRGLQSLQDVIKGCELPASQVKQALLLLVQHNFASAYTLMQEEVGPSSRGAKPPAHVYEAHIDIMLQILRCGAHGRRARACHACRRGRRRRRRRRHSAGTPMRAALPCPLAPHRRPRILLLLREEHGLQAEQAGELILEHGRITWVPRWQQRGAALRTPPSRLAKRTGLSAAIAPSVPGRCRAGPLWGCAQAHAQHRPACRTALAGLSSCARPWRGAWSAPSMRHAPLRATCSSPWST